jgi:hypothetical protein
MQMTREGLQKFAGRAGQVVEDLWRDTVLIAGVQYQAAVAPASVRGEITEGGEVLRSEISVRVRKSLLPERPATGTQVVWRGRKYQLENPSAGNDNDAWHYLQCSEWNS